MYCVGRLQRAVDEDERRRRRGTAAGSRRTPTTSRGPCPGPADRRGRRRVRRFVRHDLAAASTRRPPAGSRSGGRRTASRRQRRRRRGARAGSCGHRDLLGLALARVVGRAVVAVGSPARRVRSSSPSLVGVVEAATDELDEDVLERWARDLRRARMCAPRPPSAPTTPPSAPSSARTRLTATVWRSPDRRHRPRPGSRETTPGSRPSAREAAVEPVELEPEDRLALDAPLELGRACRWRGSGRGRRSRSARTARRPRPCSGS